MTSKENENLRDTDILVGESLISVKGANMNAETEILSVPSPAAVEIPKKSRKHVRKSKPEPVEFAPSFGSYAAVSEPEPELGVLDQIRAAWKSPLAFVIGLMLGSFIPVATYSIKHFDKTLPEWLMWTLVGGGLLYSALTVWKWTANAFQSSVKAVGFVVLVEGVMTVSGLEMLSYAALAILAVINGISTGANLSLKGQKRGRGRRR